MWIVAYALRHPISIAAMAALMMLLGVVAFFAMPKDIFPGVDIREVNMVWYYRGMSADLRSMVVKVSPSARELSNATVARPVRL
jgi:multidrug efflux pump subunit AcrB